MCGKGGSHRYGLIEADPRRESNSQPGLAPSMPTDWFYRGMAHGEKVIWQVQRKHSSSTTRLHTPFPGAVDEQVMAIVNDMRRCKIVVQTRSH